MTITIPTNWPVPGFREYAGRAPIQAPDWSDLAEGAHYLFEKVGVFFGGRVFATDSATKAADYTDTIFMAAVPTRILQDDTCDIVGAIYGIDCDVSMSLVNLDTSATIDTLNISVGGGYAWNTATSSRTNAEISEGGVASNDITMIYSVVDIDTTSGTAGEILHVGLYGSRSLASADIPYSRT